MTGKRNEDFNSTFVPRFRRLLPATTLAAAAFLLSACTVPADASRSLKFNAASDTAIVVIATSVSRAQEENVGTQRSLSTFWQEYDPDKGHLVPDGKTFVTSVVASSFTADPAYLQPTVSVLEVDPGDYALIGAGFPNKMVTYVSLRPTRLLNDSLGSRRSWTHTVDPRDHIDPEAAVDPHGNFLFSVAPGQIVYLGDFRFIKWVGIDSLVRIDYSLDEAAARAALKDYPGITGRMTTLNLGLPTETASR